MYLVQITITDIDNDETVKSESRTCEHFSLTESSSDGLTLECDRRSTGRPSSGDGGQFGLGAAISLGLKTLKEAAAASDRAKAQASAAADGDSEQRSSGCCGAEGETSYDR